MEGITNIKMEYYAIKSNNGGFLRKDTYNKSWTSELGEAKLWTKLKLASKYADSLLNTNSSTFPVSIVAFKLVESKEINYGQERLSKEIERKQQAMRIAIKQISERTEKEIAALEAKIKSIP